MNLVHAACIFVTSLFPAQDSYQLPPEAIQGVVDRAQLPAASLSPDAAWMLLQSGPALPSLLDVTRPMERLAGVRIDPETNDRHRTRFVTSLRLRRLSDGEESPLSLPEGARVAEVSWSPASDRIAFTVAATGGLELWVARVANGKPRRVLGNLNGALGRPFTWGPGGQSLVVRVVDPERGERPAAPRVPLGPTIQVAGGGGGPVRTYQDLLKTPHDAALFAWFAAARLVVVELEDWVEVRPMSDTAGMLASFELSPDGRYLLVRELEQPFSYLHSWRSFPQRLTIRQVGDPEGGRVVRELEKKPLADRVPIGGVPEGLRQVMWNPHHRASLVWVEALDGGDPKREVAHRDQWLWLPEPFDAEPREIVRMQDRASRLQFTESPTMAFASEYDRDRRWTRTWLLDLQETDGAPRVVEDRSWHDVYGDPGDFSTQLNAGGERLIQVEGDLAYRIGEGAASGGARPFLDRVNLITGETKRLWQCAPGSYETVQRVVLGEKPGEPLFITRYESTTEPPNWRLRAANLPNFTELTAFTDPVPELRQVQKRLVQYRRADGVPLSGTLYLPPSYEPGQVLPLFVWAYPIEYSDASVAGQVRGTPHRFTMPRGASHLLLTLAGYAVLDNATMPIIGDAETMNDTFIEQAVAAAEAAVQAMVDEGISDGKRVAVGGHSYGAFMTANLLAHSDVFATGIARSGAYNRTLTPFGFQSERRTLWEAPEIYFAVSPFLHAHKINEPLLLIHGAVDNNAGTYPIQSDRLFHALSGNGGTARYVSLPGESHGYRARESVLHVMSEMVNWLDEHLAPEGP